MLLTSLSRADLLNLKDKTRLQKLIYDIYLHTVQTAIMLHKTRAEYCLPISNDGFYNTNMKTILRNLQEVFPDCNVTHTLLSRGKDGVLYNISKVDDSTLSLVEDVLDNSYILVDWSR